MLASSEGNEVKTFNCKGSEAQNLLKLQWIFHYWAGAKWFP